MCVFAAADALAGGLTRVRQTLVLHPTAEQLAPVQSLRAVSRALRSVMMQVMEIAPIAAQDGTSLGLASIDVRSNAAPRQVARHVVPYASPALRADGISARYIGVNLVATLADGRVLRFQWRDSSGTIYRRRVASPSVI
jgi:hypothetical protein